MSTSTNPFSVSYRSRGSLLVYGDADQLGAVLPLLPPGIKALAVSVEGTDGLSGSSSTQMVPGAVVSVTGHLGCFRATAAGPEGPLDLGPLSPNGEGLFDLILDLYPQPLIDREVPPLGYARSGAREEGLADKLERLVRLVGNINKPRYFNFDAARCAHDRHGVPGCHHCLDACPAGAIGDGDQGIRIDPYLCRGCGSCTLVCPTGAVTYARPKPAVTLSGVAELLAGSAAGQTAAPVLAIRAGNAPAISDSIPSLEVTAIGSVGIELWFAALALGASRVLILRSGLLPPTSTRLLAEQVDLARSLLGALGEAPERIRLVDDPDQVDWQGLPNPWPALEPSVLARHRNKRSLLLAALGHLAAHLSRVPQATPMDADAPFGALHLRDATCTLCHACTGLCPTGALRARDGGLAFEESACVQCGLCVRGCPEKALETVPGFFPETLLAGSERVLKPGSEMFCCVECGAPFAARSLVEGSMAHVKDHPMFQDDGLRLLQMCMECRQKNTLGISG